MPAIDITDDVKQNAVKIVLARGVTSCVATSPAPLFESHNYDEGFGLQLYDFRHDVDL
jgi:hypothetical protein